MINALSVDVQEPVESLPAGDVLDLDRDKKLHVIFGGTKVVQHTAVAKGSEGIRRELCL